MAVWSAPELNEVSKGDRWDAEYFQPEHRQLEVKLKAKCKDSIGTVACLSASIFNPFKVGSDFRYVEIAGVSLDIGEVSPETVSTADAAGRAKYILEGGELLVSTIRPNRSCIGLLGSHAKGWVASSGFAVLKPESSRIRSFLFTWLKMQSATDWLERCAKASMYPAVSVADILQTPVPLLSDSAIDSVHALIVEMEQEINDCNCGVKTNVITAVEIRERYTGDTTQFPTLVNATAKNFTMREVSADKGYMSAENNEVVAKHGATPFIAFKAKTKARAGGLFEKMWHYFSFRRENFLAHYHKRSNVESTFSMMKAKFGDSIRSKTDVAMKNEALAKILCHNIVVLIHEMYELGIEPTFWANRDGALPVAMV